MEFSSWLGEFNGSGGLEPTLKWINIRNYLEKYVNLLLLRKITIREMREKNPNELI